MLFHFLQMFHLFTFVWCEKKQNSLNGPLIIITIALFPPSDKQKETLVDTLLKWLYDRFGVYIEDFRFQPEETTVETEEPLSAKRSENILKRSVTDFCVLAEL